MKYLVALALTLAAAPALAQPAVTMGNMKGMNPSAMTMASGAGVVKALDVKAGTVTIQHGPIAALKWPAMTMTFKASPPSLLREVKVGEPVDFKLMQMGGSTDLTGIKPH